MHKLVSINVNEATLDDINWLVDNLHTLKFVDGIEFSFNINNVEDTAFVKAAMERLYWKTDAIISLRDNSCGLVDFDNLIDSFEDFVEHVEHITVRPDSIIFFEDVMTANKHLHDKMLIENLSVWKQKDYGGFYFADYYDGGVTVDLGTWLLDVTVGVKPASIPWNKCRNVRVHYRDGFEAYQPYDLSTKAHNELVMLRNMILNRGVKASVVVEADMTKFNEFAKFMTNANTTLSYFIKDIESEVVNV